MEKSLYKHVFNFNPHDNGGESLTLISEFYDNGDYAAGLDDGIFTNQTLTLHSYCNSASFNLNGAGFTPENLRRLANELDETQIKAQSQVKMKV